MNQLLVLTVKRLERQLWRPKSELSLAIFGADITLSPSWSFCIDIGALVWETCPHHEHSGQPPFGARRRGILLSGQMARQANGISLY
jgi:hypothetical protein